MRAALIAIVVVVIVTAGLLWWAMREPTVPGVADPTTSTSAEPSVGFRRQAADEASDAGVGRIAGRVMLDAETPAVGARVRLFDQRPELMVLECGVCQRAVVSCDHPSTVQQVIDGVRANRFVVPKLLAEAVADETGAFAFEGLPLDAQIFATLGDRSLQTGVQEEEVYELATPLTREVLVTDATSTPLRGHRVFLFEPWEGRLIERLTDAHGQVTAASLDWDTYAFVEAEGMMPVGELLSEVSQFELGAPRTLIVHTLLGGQPIDADVALQLHGQDRVLHSKGGVLRIEGLPFEYLIVNVTAEGLAAAEQMVDLAQPVTEVTFELRRGAKVLVTVITEDGDPVEEVSGSLQGSDVDVRGEAEKGALLVLGPVPEGEYTLSVNTAGMVPVTRQLDLQPGDNTLEVVLRPAPRLTGKVVLPDGKIPERARVTLYEGDEDLGIEFADDEGKFNFDLPYPGTFKVIALSAHDGVAELELTVPGPPITLTLNPRGVLEVELFDVNGAPLAANFIVRPQDAQQEVKWVAIDEETKWVGRLAGLKGGKYTLEHEVPQRVPIKREVEIVEGKTTRVSIKADKGVSIAGRVIDADGKPVENATVVTTERGEPIVTDGQGLFEREGLAPGEVELWAVHPNGADSEKVKAKAPARDVVLKFAPPAWVSGRVVDKNGKPITAFTANLEKVQSGEGRFKVQAPARTLEIEADGYSGHYLSVADGDVGDVVLSQSDWIEGDVVDTEGKPVGGATVMTSFGQSEVVTDARGRFKVEIVFPEETSELIATRGAFSGRAPATLGQPAHLVLRRGTLVLGRVVDASGKGVPTMVTATSKGSPRAVEIETDTQGKFQLELARGVWLFSSRSFRTARAVELAGDRLELTLGEDASSCGAVLVAEKPMDSVWVLSRPTGKDEGPWDVSSSVPGSFELSLNTPSTSVPVRGIPCGTYEIAVSIENMVSSLSVELRQPGQQVKMPLPLTSIDPEPEPTAPTP